TSRPLSSRQAAATVLSERGWAEAPVAGPSTNPASSRIAARVRKFMCGSWVENKKPRACRREAGKARECSASARPSCPGRVTTHVWARGMARVGPAPAQRARRNASVSARLPRPMRTPSENEVRKLVREAVERALGGKGSSEPAPRREPPPVSPRRVAIGSDHGGFALKEILRKAITDEMGWQVHDCGTHSEEAVDYPDFAAAVAREVAGGRAARGIVVDAAGIGSTMAANKIAGVRCALCHDDATVKNSREHNDANVLALG